MIRAERIGGMANAPTAQTRALLAVPPEERLALRHVRLSCGDVVLSEGLMTEEQLQQAFSTATLLGQR